MLDGYCLLTAAAAIITSQFQKAKQESRVLGRCSDMMPHWNGCNTNLHDRNAVRIRWTACCLRRDRNCSFLSLFFFPRSHGQTAWRGKTCNFTICILSSLPRKMHFCFTVLPFSELSQSWREQKCGKSIFQLWTQPWRWLFCANEKWHKHPTAAYLDPAGKK